MPAPRPVFGPTTLKVNETKSDLLQMIERAQLEILYRHPRPWDHGPITCNDGALADPVSECFQRTRSDDKY